MRICKECNERPCKKRSANSDKYRTMCSWCEKRKYGYKEARKRYNKKNKRPYRKHLGDKCDSCGFIPINKCQLDVDHIDGDHKNNNLTNLQTLCANCHRLKTFLNQDWKSS